MFLGLNRPMGKCCGTSQIALCLLFCGMSDNVRTSDFYGEYVFVALFCDVIASVKGRRFNDGRTPIHG